VGTAPASWSLFQPEGKEPVKLNVIDQVGGMGPRKRTGQYWVLETGNGWGTVWVDNRVKGRGGKHRDFMDDGAGASADEGLLIVRRLQG